MNFSNLALVALLFLLTSNNTISTTQLLLLLALISTTSSGLFNNNCNCNCNNTTNWKIYTYEKPLIYKKEFFKQVHKVTR